MSSGFPETKPPAFESRVRAAHAQASRIVLVIALSIVVETVIALFIVSSREPAGTQTLSMYTFYVAAVFLAFGSIVYRRAQMRRLRLEVVAGLRGVEGLVKHLSQVTIISAAMAEAIGLLTIPIAIYGGQQMDVIRFGVVSMVVGLFTYPRLGAWQRVVDFFAAAAPGK